jgi:hypothetical protein
MVLVERDELSEGLRIDGGLGGSERVDPDGVLEPLNDDCVGEAVQSNVEQLRVVLQCRHLPAALLPPPDLGEDLPDNFFHVSPPVREMSFSPV